MEANAVKNKVREYIVNEFLPGEALDSVTDTTELITGHIVDSLATLQLVAFLEDSFRITIEPHETDIVYLNTINDIAELVVGKSAAGS